MRTIMSLAKHLAFLAVGLSLSLASGEVAAGVVAVVSAQSAVTTLSREQIANIFLGKTSVSPSGEALVPIDQAEGSPLRDEFYARYAGKSAAQIKAYWSKIIFTGRGYPPAAVPDSAAVKQKIIENPHAIGYIDQSLVDDSVRVLSPP